MKRFLTILIIAAVAATSSISHAGDKTGLAATLTQQIKSYLATEGYVPTIDSDNDIQFKKEGDSYYIGIQNYDDGVYIDVYTLDDISGIDLCKARAAADKAQTSLKFVRLDFVSDTMVSCGVVGYYESLDDFKKMLDNIFTIISTADRRFISNILED